MADFKPGDRVQVNLTAGIVPGEEGTPDWQAGTVEQRLPNGLYRILLDEPISDRTAEKEALPEHVRPLT